MVSDRKAQVIVALFRPDYFVQTMYALLTATPLKGSNRLMKGEHPAQKALEAG